MKKINCLVLLSMLMIQMTGCAPGNNAPVPPTATVNPEFLQATPFSGPITLEILKNAEYQVQNGMKLVKLANGSFQEGSGTDYLSVNMLDVYALGDLNGDGVEDAAVILVENYGGTGQFEYLVPVFFVEGGAVSPSSGNPLGDRVIVNSMNISSGVIKLDMLVHTPNDGLCCPSLSMSQSYRFYSGPGLIMVHATSGTETAFREIKIELPAQGSEVTRQIQLKGSVTIAPFENTLKIVITDANYGPIYDGSIMVNAVDMGAPGTFDVVIDLSTIPTDGGPLHVEISEVSMADGSTLTLASVDVILK